MGLRFVAREGKGGPYMGTDVSGGSGGGGFRVLVSNEPRSYREAMSLALRRLRPGLEVILLDPCLLEEALAGSGADVVLCTGVTQIVEELAPAWVDLYPRGASLARVRSDGRTLTLPDPDLLDVLDLLDRAGALEPGSDRDVVRRGESPRTLSRNGVPPPDRR